MSLAFYESVKGAVPTFTKPPKGIATVSIREGGPGRSVYNVTATDTDNGIITYSLKSQTSSSDFAVASNGLVTTSAEINFETIASPKTFTLTISAASDHNKTTDTATATLTINITDATPTFSDKSYCAAVASNASKGTIVGTYNATDGEASQNIVSNYSISSGDDATDKKFNISAKEGILTTTGKAFNKTVKSIYNLTVTASDGKNEGTTKVNVILDGSCGSNGMKKKEDSGNNGNTIKFSTVLAGIMFLLLQII